MKTAYIILDGDGRPSKLPKGIYSDKIKSKSVLKEIYDLYKKHGVQMNTRKDKIYNGRLRKPIYVMWEIKEYDLI